MHATSAGQDSGEFLFQGKLPQGWPYGGREAVEVNFKMTKGIKTNSTVFTVGEAVDIFPTFVGFQGSYQFQKSPLTIEKDD